MSSEDIILFKLKLSQQNICVLHFFAQEVYQTNKINPKH